eukprot:991107-Rhodomonas_salina.2
MAPDVLFRGACLLLMLSERGSAWQVTGWSNEDSEFSLLLDDNPLLDFVELPEELRNLKSLPLPPLRASSLLTLISFLSASQPPCR